MGEHDHTGGGLLSGIERLVHIGEQLLREGVAIGGGVEGDRGDPIDHRDVDQLPHDGRL